MTCQNWHYCYKSIILNSSKYISKISFTPTLSKFGNYLYLYIWPSYCKQSFYYSQHCGIRSIMFDCIILRIQYTILYIYIENLGSLRSDLRRLRPHLLSDAAAHVAANGSTHDLGCYVGRWNRARLRNRFVGGVPGFERDITRSISDFQKLMLFLHSSK